MPETSSPTLWVSGDGFNRGSQVRITAGQSEQKDILHRGWAAVKAANWPNYGQMSKYFANKGKFSPEVIFHCIYLLLKIVSTV